MQKLHKSLEKAVRQNIQDELAQKSGSAPFKVIASGDKSGKKHPNKPTSTGKILKSGGAKAGGK